MSDKLINEVKKLTELSLTSALPFRIDSSTSYEDGKGFAIQVETQITITSISTTCQGATLVGATLEPGIYYIPIQKITISGGTAFIYRRQ
jgi:hypothetical protein